MCGRFSQFADRETVADMLRPLGEVQGLPASLTPRYNIAPTQVALTVVARNDAPQGAPKLAAAPMIFGIRPHFMTSSVINARAETVADKPMFRALLARQRCLIVASGFYEWQTKADGKKVPHHFSRTHQAPFVLAGLYRPHDKDKGKGNHDTQAGFVIVTTAANACVRPIHHRMPVMLPMAAAAAWLCPATPVADLLPLMAPYPSDAMVGQLADRRVNAGHYTGPTLP